GTNITTLTISIEGISISKTINITVHKEIIIPPPRAVISIESSDISIIENKTANVSAVVKDQFDNIMNGGYTLKYRVGDSSRAEVDENSKVTENINTVVKDQFNNDDKETLNNSKVDNTKKTKIIFFIFIILLFIIGFLILLIKLTSNRVRGKIK
ncbi:hypothetical protein, partial [Clostridium gasigenes]|uniref:hypothetical protein n=1 Tax=Clostridium gasigenes TaxID=94869 RepID=UPI001C0B7950